MIGFLKKQKTFQDRIPNDYITNANKVADLFQMQTVYNPQTEQLEYNEELKDGVDQEFLGPHSLFEGILADFVRGEIVKSTKQPRESYMGQKVIDMSKIRMDFARNEVSAGTLKILDRNFFVDPQAPNYSALSTKMTDGISKMLDKPVKVT